MNGYDFSAFQGNIDWSQINADFVFLRASDGVNITANGLANSMDTTFQANALGADSRKIKRGAYHVYTSDNIDAQFNRFFTVPHATDGMVALDVEPTVMSYLTPARVQADIKKWMQYCLTNLKRPSLIYMNVSTYQWLNMPIDYLWLADPSQVDNSIPRIVTQRQTAIIPGVNGQVDTDTWEGTELQFNTLLGVNIMSNDITVNKAPVVILAAEQGYYIVTADGGVFTFGSAPFYGSAGNLNLVLPIVSAALTSTGKGYYLMGADGGVFAFGDAKYAGRVTVG